MSECRICGLAGWETLDLSAHPVLLGDVSAHHRITFRTDVVNVAPVALHKACNLCRTIPELASTHRSHNA